MACLRARLSAQLIVDRPAWFVQRVRSAGCPARAQAHSHGSPIAESDIDLQARKQQKLLLAEQSRAIECAQ